MSLLQLAAKRLDRLGEFDRFESLVSRRNLLLGGIAAVLAKTQAARAAPPPSNLRWLVNRITMGWTPDEQLLADTYAYHGYLEYHLNYQAIDDSAAQAKVGSYSSLVMEPFELLLENSNWVRNQLIETTLIRAVHSKRQLYERMVEFWTDHFNIDITKAECPWLKTIDDKEVIRANALGNFKTMLTASARSPAMLVYLDNATSVTGNPNENYARELMELHTLGVSGGYTQQDVVEVARCFTGWSVDLTGMGNQNPNKGKFYYQASWHDTGQKTVLGQTIPAGGGMSDALTVIDILCNHPSTANFIATKLCKRFYGYSPPSGLVSAVAAAFTSTGGDIKAMLRALFSNADPAAAQAKLKRPYHLFVSAMRATGANLVGNLSNFNSELRLDLASAGQESFMWGPPDGYPDSVAAWSGLLLPRWSFVTDLMNNDVEFVATDIDAFLAGAGTAQQIADRINQVIFGSQMPAAERDRIRDYLLPDLPTTQRKREAAGLALAAPSFQWY